MKTMSSRREQERLAGELCTAICTGDLRHVRACIKRGADVEYQPRDSGHGAIHIAAGSGRLPIVRYLVKKCHANLNTTNNVGMTSLLIATIMGHLDVVRFLIQD